MAAGRTLKIHLKADTGMSRLGLVCDHAHLSAAVEEMAAIAALPGLEVEGVFTHLADAEALLAGRLPGEPEPGRPCWRYHGRWVDFYGEIPADA